MTHAMPVVSMCDDCARIRAGLRTLARSTIASRCRLNFLQIGRERHCRHYAPAWALLRCQICVEVVLQHEEICSTVVMVR